MEKTVILIGSALHRFRIERDLEASEKSARDALASLEKQSRNLEKRVTDRTADLAEANKTLRKLSRQLMDAQEEERRHIARELHDEMGQQLTSLKLMMESFGQEDVPANRARLRQGARIVATLMKQVSDLCFDLRESLPNHISLETGLRCLLEKFDKDHGLKVKLRIVNRKTVHSVAPAITRAVLRMAQEALTNMIRHARTRSGEVVISKRAGLLRVEFSDEGRGFTPSIKTNRNGLRGMKERITLLGGSFTVASKPGNGTRLCAMIPLSVR